MANSNFVVQNGLTVGPLTIFAGNGDIITGGNITSTSVTGPEITNSLVVTTTATIGTSLSAGSVYAATIGNSGATLTGTLSTASQPNITTLGGVTSIGASGSTTLTGTLQTASQPNITTLAGVTSIGTSGSTTTLQDNLVVAGNLTVNGTTVTVDSTTVIGPINPSANLSVNDTIGNVTYWWNTGYVGTGYFNSATVGGTMTAGSFSGAGTGLTGTAGSLNIGGTAASETLATVTGRGASTTTTMTTGTILPSANVTYNLGSSSAWFNQFYGVATHAQYADLAENYQGDRFYNPGTVVMFGGSAEVTVADADTTRVAGVVSTNPAHLMNGALTGVNVVPLALTGRVPCMVIGPVAKGDLMVSAGFGYAKTNNAPAIGTIIGKALEDFPMQAKGVIEVVVGRF